MDFEPIVRRKPRVNIKWFVKLIPTGPGDGCKYKAYFTGISVEVVDSTAIKNLYNCGCYGKGSISRGVPELLNARNKPPDPRRPRRIAESLALDFEEAFFLAFVLDVLEIYDIKEKKMNWEEVLTAACKVNANFLLTLSAYFYLKSKSWVIKSGIKYGGQFMIYKKGPRYFHGSFVVVVVSPTEREFFVGKNLKGTLRVAETAAKDVLVLTVLVPPDFQPREIDDFSDVDVTELIVRRFQAAKHASKQKNEENKHKQTEKQKQKEQQKQQQAAKPPPDPDAPLSKRAQKRLRKKEAAEERKKEKAQKLEK